MKQVTVIALRCLDSQPPCTRYSRFFKRFHPSSLLIITMLALLLVNASQAPASDSFIKDPGVTTNIIFFYEPGDTDDPLIQGHDFTRSINTNVTIDFPLLVTSDDFSDITTGAAWDLSLNAFPSTLRQHELRNGTLTSDGSFNFQSTGSWLFNADLNRRPLTGRLHYDYGFELIPRPINQIDSDLVIDGIQYTDMGFWNWLYHYRMALTLEAGAEADQRIEAGYLTLGPGLRILNLSRTGWSGWLPTLSVMYEGVFRLTQSLNGPGDGSSASSSLPADDSNSEHHRLRIVYRHQLDLSSLKLRNTTVAAGFQYTRDFGQADSYTDAGLHSRFGWVADLSYALRWSGREEFGRLDLFVRFTDGRIAPLVTSDRSFTFGFRIPYSR